jgi:hypothetical protein
MKDGQQKKLLTLPDNAVRVLLSKGGVITHNYLSATDFSKFCKARDLAVSVERLLTLERLRLFQPIFRIRKPKEKEVEVRLPLENLDHFTNERIIETYDRPATYIVPEPKSKESEPFYSQFQIDDFSFIHTSMTMQLCIDGYLESSLSKPVDWGKSGEQWLEYARSVADGWSKHQFRPSMALLCQYISDRYAPNSQGDMRTILIQKGAMSFNQWFSVFSRNWDWREYCRNWDANEVAQLFSLTEEKLRHAYTSLASSQASHDPIEKWYPLTQFVSVKERDKLKGSALYSETVRRSAIMLGLLYKELYKSELPQFDEVLGTILTHFPEKEIRVDPLKHLKYVVNRFNLNPQPKVTLFVEGESEEIVVESIFEKILGAHHGKFGIEIINLHGVDTATGGKADRFRAILRLVDYLHHHQTITFLILDNENYAKKLKKEAREAKSKHHKKRHVTRSEYIKVWKNSLEFDNYSASELADALTRHSKGHAKFSAVEINSAQKGGKGDVLSNLFFAKTNHDLNKIEFNRMLVNNAIDEIGKFSRKKFTSREIYKVLSRVAQLATKNHWPTREEIWEINQKSKYLGKKVKK